MDVNRTQGAASVPNKGGGDSGGQSSHHQKDQTPDDDGAARDNAVELGGLAAEITPAIQALLDNLSAEIEPLRAELAMTREREQLYREELARHAFLPVPGRREFTRELNHVLNHLGDLTVLPSLVLINVAGADAVRRRHGRDALDRLLARVARMLNAALSPTDVLGNLGGNDFAVILLGMEKAAASERARDLAENLAKPDDGGAPIEIVTGIAEFERGMSADALIRAADRDMASRS